VYDLFIFSNQGYNDHFCWVYGGVGRTCPYHNMDPFDIGMTPQPNMGPTQPCPSW